MKFTTLSGARITRRFTALATVSGLAIASMATPAFAQDADGIPDNEESEAGTPEGLDQENVILVTGYRRSLETAQDIKREADTVVDVLSAEDIGALADRSVAEALQRVPGVNISRFANANDPDRFSVEGTDVIIRGLPYVRSELNGRDIFSANGGRTLSFNDVSPELLGRVEVFKNTTADMIEGSISGTVNLVTRKPLDNPGLNIAGTVEVNVGDLAEEWSPGFSILGSNTFELGNAGVLGIQLAYAQQELVTRTDASQITDPCYRDPDLAAGCLRVQPVNSGGFFGDRQFDETNFPPEDAIIVPQGGGVRTTGLERDRQAISGVVQWESNDGRARITAEYLRADTDQSIEEFSALALVNDPAFFPTFTDGSAPIFNGNLAETFTLTQISGFGVQGLPTENLRFQQRGEATTEDFSLDLDLSPTDRLSFNIELQHIRSTRESAGFIAAMQTFSEIFVDNSGDTPQIRFLQPGTTDSPSAYFTDPSLNFYWFNIDNQEDNEGDLTSMRFDAEYDVGDGFIKEARFGARWADRNRVTRNTNYSNWSNLGAPWTGRNGNWNCDDYQAFGCGGAYVSDFPEFAEVRSPFADNFQRGNAPTPFGDGSAFFFGPDDLVGAYLDGDLAGPIAQLQAFTLTPEGRPLLYQRLDDDGTLCDPFCARDVSDVEESTNAAYVRVDFGTDLGSDIRVAGNIGVRYVDTEVRVAGFLGFPNATGLGFDQGTEITVDLLRENCAEAPEGTPGIEYCALSDSRLAEFAASYTGETVTDNSNIKFDHWLPSFNIKAEFGDGVILRGAVSRGISRPDLNSFQTGGVIGRNLGALAASDTLETGPLFAIDTGNRDLLPITSWNYDISAEWYFDDVGSITAAFFLKKLDGIFNRGAQLRNFTSPSDVTTDVLYTSTFNFEEGTLKGVEFAYQQTYDFLPSILTGLGTQLTYTYVDAGDFDNTFLEGASPFAGSLPLTGVSEHTVNATVFYDYGPISARAAYNWRSEFLQTTRDVIFPFQPIFAEETGQLDASIFYTLTDNIKIGVQGVNLLDEVTRTSQVIDFDGTRVTRSAFRNDRRYTFLARFNF